VAAPDLTGRVAIVTGASRGIGKALAVGLARHGAAVVCAARTEREEPGSLPGTVHATADAIRAEGHTALAVRCDIGVQSDIEDLVARTVGEFGRIDALVNNAMTPTRTAFADSTLEQWDDSMRVNVRSLYLFCRAVVPHMEKTGGNIVNISSGGAEHATTRFMPPGYLFYVVAKAALERFTSAIAPELRPLDIAINALRPGAVKTEHVTQELGAENDWSGWSAPESVVAPVAYLCAQADRDFTGRILDVSGFGTDWGK
jgi:NAD(P)-dependent dehydrogenase (short-subunit alcohol dehydrogenase family)